MAVPPPMKWTVSDMERWGGVSTATIQYVWSPVYVEALVLRDRSTLNNGTLDERLWVQQDARSAGCQGL